MAKNFGRVNVSITASTGGLTAGLSSASRQLRGFGDNVQGIGGTITSAVAGFVGLGRGASAAAIGVRILGESIKALLGPLLIVATLVELFARIGKTASDLDTAGKAASRLGMSMTTFQSLSAAAQESGVSVEHATALFTTMTRNLGQLASGSASAQRAFAAIGLTLDDLQGLNPEQQFELIAQRIAALPTAAQRTSAAMAVFGRQGAAAMGFLQAAASGAVSEMRALQDQLGVNITDQQVAGIQLMNDALSRMSLVFQGFLNQLIAGLAPAIATAARLVVDFFAKSTSGFSIAKSLADLLTASIRNIAAAVTFLYGTFQVLSSFVGVFVSGVLTAIDSVLDAIATLISSMRRVAESLPGMDVGVARGLRAAEESLNALSTAAGDEAAIWGQAAAENFADGVRNMSNPFAAFDAEFASVTAQMQEAGAAAGQAAGQTISSALSASTKALNAIVVGTTEGEAFRNSILRGADPRLEGNKEAQRTADATEETAEGVGELASLMRNGGMAQAAIMV